MRLLTEFVQDRVVLPDPSEEVHANAQLSKIVTGEAAAAGECLKQADEFRNYDEGPLIERIRRTYYTMHTEQTIHFAKQIRERWLKFDHAEMTIMEALEVLNGIIDESDPDTDVPNIMHAFQTAERIRNVHPDKPWLQLTGLIHDLGKIMAFYGEPQWAVVGDTFVVGCEPEDKIVFGKKSFENNPDMKDNKLSSKFGIYEPNCGLDNLIMSWGHDEYMFQVLKHNGCKLPEEGMAIVRYHSFYPWHTSGGYSHLTNESDQEKLRWVREFNKFDLYSKSDPLPDIEALRPYYQALIDQYCPGNILF